MKAQGIIVIDGHLRYVLSFSVPPCLRGEAMNHAGERPAFGAGRVGR